MSEKKYVIDDKNLMSEWDYDKNNKLSLDPQKLTYGSNKKAWWKCITCGYEWIASIHNRSKGTKCVNCSKKMQVTNKNASIVLKKGSLLDNHPEIANEWDYEKNFPLTPKDVSSGSGKKVWWICSQGHNWMSRIDHRANGSKCIYCTNQKAIQGVNDLVTLYPNLIQEWDYEKNKDLTPSTIKPNSNKKAWWICPLGHSWKTTISHRTSGTRCPKCFKEYGTSFAEQSICYYLSKHTKVENRTKINNFEVDIFLPDFDIGFEYDGIHYHSSNKSLQNDKIKDKFFSNTKFKLYRIKESNKNFFDVKNSVIYCIPDRKYKYIEYILEQIQKILNLVILPVNINNDNIDIYNQYIKSIKTNSLLNTNPILANEWDYSKNGNLLPENFTYGSTKKVWWICKHCHSSYLASIGHRNNGTSCPFCAGKLINNTNNLKNVFPELMIFWDFNKNIDLNPQNIYFNSRKKVWWICPTCKKSYIRSLCLMTKSKTHECKECMHKTIGLKNQNISVLKKGSLKDSYPKLIKEWNYNKNIGLYPDSFSENSGKKVWWICEKCKFEWEATIYNRTNGTGCPKCKTNKNSNSF